MYDVRQRVAHKCPRWQGAIQKETDPCIQEICLSEYDETNDFNCIYFLQVPLKKVHFFTAIQVFCLAVLWVIKSFKQTSILFPLMVCQL